MHFNLLTIFPELYPGPLGHSLSGKGLEAGLWSFEAVNIRDFAESKHGTVDDTPYGGGAGMVMKPDVLARALDYVIEKEGKRVNEPTNQRANEKEDSLTRHIVNSSHRIIYPSPRGKLLTQRKIEEFAALPSLTMVCGRYEGIDQRVIDKYGIEEVSIGDYILTNGDLAAFVIIDACIRNINGVLGNPQTTGEESFCGERYSNLLEYPHFTKPSVWENLEVPEVLKNGNHKLIDEWRFEQAVELTKNRRPDLYKKYLAESLKLKAESKK